jgi:protein-disulfide isomerase
MNGKLWVSCLVFGVSTASVVCAQQPAASEPLAIVNGTAITSAEVESALGPSLAKLEEQVYELKRTKLNALIDDTLIAVEAKKRGISTDALIQAEVTAKLTPVTDEEIAVFYGANQARLQKDLNAWRGEVRTFLVQQRAAERRQAFAKELRAVGKVEVLLAAPKLIRADVSTAGAFAKGGPAAPVTIVEFSDFHCPFCKRVQPVVTQVLQKYGDKVRLVYKDFPLDSLHPQARAASEAARCAGEQGKFWEFHDKIYAGSSESSAATMTRYAKEVAVGDMAKFEACVTSRKYQAVVQRDVAEGVKLGLSGTPGFFINGRLLSGAQPLEAFASIIDAELEQQQNRR